MNDNVKAAIEEAMKYGDILSVRRICTNVINALEQEIARLKKEGVPGVMHEVDAAFYRLAIKERDFERQRVDALAAEIEGCHTLMDATGEITKDRRPLRQRVDDLVAAYHVGYGKAIIERDEKIQRRNDKIREQEERIRELHDTLARYIKLP